MTRAAGSAVVAVARAHGALAAFTLTYLVAFSVLGAALGSPLTAWYAVVVGGLAVVVAGLEERHRLGTGVLWALAAWGLAHMAAGVVPVGRDRFLYNVSLVPGVVRYDQAVHAFGFGYATVACGKVLRPWVPAGAATVAPAALAALAGMGVGVLNEVVESVATLVLAETNVAGFENTGWDLVFNLVSAGAGAAWLARASVPGAAQGTRCESGAVPQL